jgi:hypothetical protein
MHGAISPEALPGWSCSKDLKVEEVTLLACFLGRYGEQPLTGPFGYAMLLWEALRHNRELIELLAKLRTPPTQDDWKNDPDYSTLFPDKIGNIVSTPGFPDIPFLSLEAACQNQLIEPFTPGQPALEIGNIEMLDAMGVLERFKQSVTLRQHKQPGERFKQDAILKREKLEPHESVYDAVFTIRAHMGIEAVKEGFERWLRDNSKLFPNVDSITIRQWEDPRPILRDLATLRLVRLYGYPGAHAWTKEHRPHKDLGAYKSDYSKYVGERGTPGNSPLYATNEKCSNAIERALKALHVLRTSVS